MHFASGRTKFAETWKPQKRQLQTCWRYSATNVAIYYIINEINKNRSKLKPCSAKVGREKTPTTKNERKENQGRSKGREGGKNLDNPSLVREGTAKSASPGWGGGGTPLYGLYRYVPRNRVWFLEVLDP